MTAINLIWTKTTNPDFSGFGFYVESGRAFDADDFASAYNLNRYDINPEHIHSVQDAAAQLGDGEWLRVEFEHTEEEADQNSLLADTDAMIADARAGMDDECRTALAIDRNDAWCDIAAAARMDGFEELASALEDADAEWES